jgi:hypothetical protein
MCLYTGRTASSEAHDASAVRSKCSKQTDQLSRQETHQMQHCDVVAMTEIHVSAVLSLSCSAEDLSSQDLVLTLFEIATRPGHRTSCVVTLIPIGWYSIIVSDHTHIDDTRTCTMRARCCCEVGRPERLHDQPHGSYYDTITCRLMRIALVSSVCESSGYLVGRANAASRSPILLVAGGPRTHD